MLTDWIQIRKEGIYIVPGEFYLDPSKPVHNALVSHAHGDHFSNGCHEIHASPGTMALLKYRSGNQLAEIHTPHAYHSVFNIGPVSIYFLPAGHIPGSAMIALTYKGIRALYTGDLGLIPHPMAEPLEYPAEPTDILITECTFADKTFIQTNPEEALQELQLRAGNYKPLLLGVYALGKAQRIIHLVHQVLPGSVILTHHSILGYNEIYKSLGFHPGTALPYRRNFTSGPTPPVLVMPPGIFRRLAASKKYHAAFVSGWDKRDISAGIIDLLPISDHPDALQLRNFIEKINPGILIPVHGDSKSLESWCIEKNITIHRLN